MAVVGNIIPPVVRKLMSLRHAFFQQLLFPRNLERFRVSGLRGGIWFMHLYP